METALNGDLKTLRAELQQAEKRGDLGDSEVRRVAHAVASREVRSVDVELAIPRIRQVHACASSLSAVLEERAEQADDAGAEAQLMLIDAGLDSRKELVDRYQRAESGAWRAVAARLTTGLGHAGLRQQLMGDGDERVRRAALTAALVARDKRDITPLLEAARVDPDALSRSRAARAAGNIGGQQVVLGLRDLWERADETTRVTIVEAWAMPGALGSGGESQLVWVVETGEALPAVSAAGALIRTESQYASSGVALLERVVKGGPATERKLAIAWLPLGEPSTLERLKEAAKDADPEIQAAALGRLLHTGERADAEKQLFKLARGKTGAAFPARLALAAGGVSEVAPLLKQDLGDKQSSVRQQAALALARISQFSSAALAMGDESPTVRTRVACSLLLALK